MTFRDFRRIAMIAAGALSLTHCAFYPAFGEKDEKEAVRVSAQQEIQMGAQAHPEVLKAYPALDNPGLQAYVNAVGQRLAKKSQRPKLKWQFTVVDSPDVNAFSLPGGYVYITRGLMAYLNSEAELAAVIGHEIGHVAARHGVRQHGAATVAGVGTEPGSVQTPEMNNQAGAALQTLAQVWTAGYGRELELEACRLGAEYLAKASYSPQAMLDVLSVLKHQELFAAEQAMRSDRPTRSYHGAFDIHPGHDARLQQVVGAAAPYTVALPREGRSEYLKHLSGVVFGENHDQNLILDNLLLHEKFGLALQFPPGWRMQNHPDRVVAINAEGDAQVEFWRGPKNDQALETLKNELMLDPGVRTSSGTLGGYPAAFAAGAQQGKPVVAAAVVFDGAQYLIAGVAKDAPAYQRERDVLRAAINSFRALTPAEKQVARPHRLKLVTVQPGMTLAALARQSPLAADAESQLRLINGLYPDGEPKPGQFLKIVQ